MIQTALKNLLILTRRCIPVLSHAAIINTANTLCNNLTDKLYITEPFKQNIVVTVYPT